MREEITMISSDENRKVIISKYTYDGCSIKMYSNGFCQMELLTYEDLFQLSKKQLRIRHCIQLVNRFLEDGIEDLSFDDIDELLKANREYMNCFIEMLFENTLEIAKGFGGIEFSTASIDVLGKSLINTSHKYEKVPYKELAKLSTAEAFYKFSGWDMYDFVNSSLSYRRKNEEAESAFALAMVNDGKIDIKDLPVILQEKVQVIKKTGILEFIQSDYSIKDIGGLDNLKNWLLKRNNSWSEQAKKYCIPAPKGVLVTGVPGCGKSLTAKAMSTIWQLPLLKLDFGKVFSGLVGSSEENMRRALATAEAVAPSILWIDEIEKGLSGLGSNGDSGVSSRIFGQFLTWMQEKEAPVFVIATANNISNLPPELLRKGRFDEIFFVDLPTLAERKEIFKLHLERRLKDKEVASEVAGMKNICTELAKMTEGFIGSEIEQVVISSLCDAFFESRPLKFEDLAKNIANTVPLSMTQREQILALRAWANVRAVSATKTANLKQYTKEINEDNVSTSRGGRTLDF